MHPRTSFARGTRGKTRKGTQWGPGNEFRYSGYGLNIAGRICEVVTKKKFDQLIKLKLFGPLTMRSCNFTEANMGPVNPSGGAKSTAEDYMKFLTMLLNHGNYKGKQIITEESIDEMMKINTKAEQIKYAPKSATGFNYASGSWVIEEKTEAKEIQKPKTSVTPVSPPGDEPIFKTTNFATALASPGLFGTWPMIDYCRGYAYLVFVKKFIRRRKSRRPFADKRSCR